MAVMINCAMDWTFDLFMEDAAQYKATPIKGVHCRADADYREQFMTWFKNMVRDFKAEWEAEHGKRRYDDYEGYEGDAFKRRLQRTEFSDFYKDAYGQRPHLNSWFYVQATGLPQDEDTVRTFCAYPVENAVKDAKRNRERF